MRVANAEGARQWPRRGESRPVKKRTKKNGKEPLEGKFPERNTTAHLLWGCKGLC